MISKAILFCINSNILMMKKNCILFFIISILFSNLYSQNLINNGDFEFGGAVGFTAPNYFQINAPFSGVSAPGQYAITTNPFPVNTSNFINGADHTGAGNMMVVDGSNNSSDVFYSVGNLTTDLCTLTIGSNYSFSFWVKSVSSNVIDPSTQPNIIANFVNATVTVNPTNNVVGLPIAGWQKITYFFTATSSCVIISLSDLNTSLGGNDFAIDDLELKEVLCTPPILTINDPAAVCAPATVDITSTTDVIIANNGILSYWEDASSTVPLASPDKIEKGGIYFIKSTLGACSDIKQVEVIINEPISPGFPEDIPVCFNTIAPVLEATSPNGIIGVWNPPVIDNMISASYVFTPDSDQCSQKQTVMVSINKDKLKDIDFDVVNFEGSQTVTVSATEVGEYTYQLDDSFPQISNVFENISPGAYNITVYDIYNCSTPITKPLLIIDYPKFFTANGDGFNDNWNIIGLGNQADAKILIFDRYGKLLKQLSPNGTGWDGTFNGEPLPANDYWFTIDYLDGKSRKQLYKSHFCLKR
jgi:gliding motility-associated-like protein